MANGNGNGRLTGLQQAFVYEYLKDFNATRAAERAGYQANGDGSFSVIGCENLGKLKIREAISEQLCARHMGKEEIAARWATIARASVEDVLHFGERGWSVDIPGAHERGELYAVKRLENTQYGMRVVMEDRLHALDSLGKAHGMFVHKEELEAGDRLASLLERVVSAGANQAKA